MTTAPRRRRLWSILPASSREATDAMVSNFLLHWFPARMRVTSLAWTPSLWLGTASWVLFVLLVLTGLPLMVFYIPSTRDAYRRSRTSNTWCPTGGGSGPRTASRRT